MTTIQTCDGPMPLFDSLRELTARLSLPVETPPLAAPFAVDQYDAEWTDAYRRDYRTGMTPVWTAWKVGFIAAASGQTKADNPYLRAGESPDRPAYPISCGWESGWLVGQGHKAEELETEFSKWRSQR